eukprot:140202-Chlamydomonas_euryale.AAC.1
MHSMLQSSPIEWMVYSAAALFITQNTRLLKGVLSVSAVPQGKKIAAAPCRHATTIRLVPARCAACHAFVVGPFGLPPRPGLMSTSCAACHAPEWSPPSCHHSKAPCL